MTPPEKNMRERIARRLCAVTQQDPEAGGLGLGWYLPKGFRGPVWEGIALHIVDPVLDELTANPGEAVLQAGANAGIDEFVTDQHAMDLAGQAFQAMVKAIRDGK